MEVPRGSERPSTRLEKSENDQALSGQGILPTLDAIRLQSLPATRPGSCDIHPAVPRWLKLELRHMVRFCGNQVRDFGRARYMEAGDFVLQHPVRVGDAFVLAQVLKP